MDAQRRTRRSAPTCGAVRPYHFYRSYNDSTLTRNKGLLVSPFLGLFLDSIGLLRYECLPLQEIRRSLFAVNPTVMVGVGIGESTTERRANLGVGLRLR